MLFRKKAQRPKHKPAYGLKRTFEDTASSASKRGKRGLTAYRKARRARYASYHADTLRPGLTALGIKFSNLLNIVYLYINATIEKLAKGRLNRANGVIIVVTLLVCIFSAQYFQMGVDVVIGGENIGLVGSQQEFDDVVELVEARATATLGYPYTLQVNPIFQFSVGRRDTFISPKDLEMILIKEVDEVKPMYVLYVDGDPVGTYPDKEAYEGALDIVKNKSARNVPEGDVTLEFTKPVEIRYTEFASMQLHRTPEEIIDILTSKKPELKEYTAKQGDTLQKIASSYNIQMDELTAVNPSLTTRGVNQGDTVIVPTQVPFISVQSVARITYDIEVPFETETVTNAKLYTTQKNVKKAGIKGIDRVVADVSYINGVQTSKVIISTTRVREPSTQIMEVGTMKPPTTATTGKMMRPAVGRLTSNYGYRGREFHTGVDFANSVGTPIVAADGGVVTRAGWRGNYGNCITIKHDNGLETLYAHNSSLMVSVGTRVAKGQQIAKMGSTGRSSGSHCHFEVLKNGKHQNPWNYIS